MQPNCILVLPSFISSEVHLTMQENIDGDLLKVPVL